jgi:hypothetical protein
MVESEVNSAVEALTGQDPKLIVHAVIAMELSGRKELIASRSFHPEQFTTSAILSRIRRLCPVRIRFRRARPHKARRSDIFGWQKPGPERKSLVLLDLLVVTRVGS